MFNIMKSIQHYKMVQAKNRHLQSKCISLGEIMRKWMEFFQNTKEYSTLKNIYINEKKILCFTDENRTIAISTLYNLCNIKWKVDPSPVDEKWMEELINVLEHRLAKQINVAQECGWIWRYTVCDAYSTPKYVDVRAKTSSEAYLQIQQCKTLDWKIDGTKSWNMDWSQTTLERHCIALETAHEILQYKEAFETFPII